MKKRVELLIDSKYLCYRTLTTQFNLTHNEVKTGVHYGFFNTLISLMRKFKPDNILLMWDSDKSYRRNIYPEYKQKRYRQTNENMIQQIEIIKEESESIRKEYAKLGFASYLQYGMEADDLFAFYTIKHLKDSNLKIIIVTGDEDIYQLLFENRVVIYNPRIKKLLTENWFVNNYEIAPSDWAYVKALGGCDSDNIPGITSIGPKTAIKYIKQEKITEKAKELIEDNQEKIEFFLKLTKLPFYTLQNKNPLMRNLRRSRKMLKKQTRLDIDRFIEYCQARGFKSFLKQTKVINELFNGYKEKPFRNIKYNNYK
jgi:5'-3' exonuclease